MQAFDVFLVEWTTAEREGDLAALDRLLAEDFVGVGPLGFTLPKPAWLQRLRSGDLRYETFDLSEVAARVRGDHAAVVTARQDARGFYLGTPVPETLRTTLTLVGEGGRWQLVGAHLSFIAGTPGAPPLPAAATGARS